MFKGGTLISQQKNPKYLLKTNCFHRGLDTVRFNFEVQFDSLLFNSFYDGLSLNSPQKMVHFLGCDFKVILSNHNGKRILNFLSLNGDALFCLENMIMPRVQSAFILWSITFYGAFFLSDGLNDFFNGFINKYKDLMYVGRCDIAIDVSSSVNDIVDNAVSIFRKGSEWYDGFLDSGENKIETKYFGNKSHNQRHFIRVYDKLEDSQQKGKFHLYQHYFVYPCVTRIELQINSLSCRKYKIDPMSVLVFFNATWQVQEGTYMWSIVKMLCFNYKQTCFEIDLVEAVTKSIPSEISHDGEILDKVRYIKRFINTAQKLKEIGYDPILLLQNLMK